MATSQQQPPIYNSSFLISQSEILLYVVYGTSITATSLQQSGPEVINLFSCSTQQSMKFALLIHLKLLTITNSFLLNIAA